MSGVATDRGTRRIIPPAAIENQRQAADPAASVWVGANAGSGKTTVLTSRVVRLLLAGAAPESILCVTFTKVAAANMQDRIFQTLAGWVALDDAALTTAIEALDGERPNPARLAAARRLFARAVETPGGLRIQTIHGLAERILQQFPFEAGVPAGFSVIDPADQATLIAEAIDGVYRRALSGDDPGLEAALLTVAQEAGDEGVASMIRAWMGVLDADGPPETKFALAPIRAVLGIAAGETVADVEAEILTGMIPERELADIADWLSAGGGKINLETASRIKKVIATSDPVAKLDCYRSIFLTEAMTPRSRKGRFITGALRNLPDPNVARMDAEQDRVAAAVQRSMAVAVATRSEAIARLAGEVAASYRAAKRRRGLLDFDDLIQHVAELLDDEAARWVQFKLDGGITHVLVDEAQDTSPAQWRILRALTAEFFAGAGARPAGRTIFAVGDEKQSIFSFQGAAPETFAETRRAFERAARDAGAAFRTVPLNVSFRTVPAVLKAVDATFADDAISRQIISDPTDYRDHEPVRLVPPDRLPAPGLVELWPPEAAESVPIVDAFAPIDAPAENAPPVRLAGRIARRIRHWLETGARLADSGLPITPGDILILVQRRDTFFESMLSALKQAGIPVAGADRMRLAKQLAVQDLLALASVMTLPEDDLTLAALLKSPLIGLDDDDLFMMRENGHATALWDALRRSSVPAHAAAWARLDRWRGLAQVLDPLRFVERIMGPEGGRRAMLGRLGPDAAEAIDGLLAQIAAFAGRKPASLVGIVAALREADAEVKRELDESAGAVRIMTVHGAKGLEAPIVFLPDTFRTAKPPGGRAVPLLLDPTNGGPGPYAWVRSTEKGLPAIAEAVKVREAAERAEHLRLLYVAMTRAKDRLYVAGFKGKNEPANVGPWYPLIEEALRRGVPDGAGRAVAVTEPAEDGEGYVQVFRLRSAAPVAPAMPRTVPLPAPAPDWLFRPAPTSEGPRLPLRPSHLVAAEPPLVGGESGPTALARLRGVVTHALIQSLPDVAPELRTPVGLRLAAIRAPGLPEDMRHAAVERVVALLCDPAVSALFGPGSRAEVDLAGAIETAHGLRPIAGRADRIAVTDQAVLVADFKTGRPPAPDSPLPHAIAAQLAVYRAVLADLHPDKPVVALVVWTALPRVDVVDNAMLDAAYTNLTQL